MTESIENDVPEMSSADLAEERLRLEREALAVERERLASARAHAAAEARLARGRHPTLLFAAVTLLALLCFAGGLLSGIVGTVVALAVAFCRKGLLTVALSACAAVLLTNLLQILL